MISIDGTDISCDHKISGLPQDDSRYVYGKGMGETIDQHALTRTYGPYARVPGPLCYEVTHRFVISPNAERSRLAMSRKPSCLIS